MSQADGTIIIDTEIRTDGVEPGAQEIKEAVSRIASTTNKVGKAVGNYSQEIIDFVDDFAESIGKASNSNNEFKNGISELEAKLAGLEEKGLYFGDEEYDNAYLELERLKNALTDYKKELTSPEPDALKLDTSTVEGQLEKLTKDIDKLRSAGKGFGDVDFDNMYTELIKAQNALKEHRKKLEAEAKPIQLPVAIDTTTMEGQIKLLRAELEGLKTQGIGFGNAEFDAKSQALKRAEQALSDYKNALFKTEAQLQKEEEAQRKLNEQLELTKFKEAAAAKEAAALRDIGMNADVSNRAIVRLREQIEQLNARQKVLEKAGLGFGHAEYDANASKIASLNARLSEYKNRITGAKKATNSMSSATNKATNSTSRFNKSLKKTKDNSNGARMSMGKMLKMSLLFSLVFRAMSAVANGVKEGFANLASHSGETNKSISMVWSSLERLKNALATAFAPILNVVAPILSKFIDMLSTAATYVSMFFSSLAGKSTYTKAIAVQKDFAESQKDTADESKDAADALNDAADAAERYMSPLDDMNTFTDKSKSSGGKGNNGGKDDDTGPMFEEVPLKTLALFEEIKDVLSKLFQPFKQSWENEGANTIAAAKFALESVLTLLKSIGKSMLEVWSNGTGVAILDTMQRIIQNIFYTIGNIAEGLNDAWNKNEVGTRIIQKIADIFLVILGFIERITGATAEWAKKIDFYPLLESIHTLLTAIEPLTQNVFDGLAWFYENVLLPLAGWAINTAVPTFLDMLSSAIDVVNSVIGALKPLAEWLWNSFLEPLANWTGEIIIAALETITDLLKKFSDWISENQTLVETLVIIVGSLATAWGLVNGAIAIWNIVGAIATGVTGVLAAAFNFLLSPIGIAVVAIGALIAIGVLLYRNWDEISAFIVDIWNKIKQKASEIWGKIKKTFEDFIVFLKSIFEKDWSKSFGAAGEVLNIFLKSVSDFWNGLKRIFNGIIEFVTGVFTGDWEKAWQGIKDIFGGVFDSLFALVKFPINAIIGAINGLVSGVTSGINAVIGALNTIHFTIPDWVPFFGGKSFGFSISKIRAPKIPYLAQGAVIPPNAPFMAMLGDQKNGTNIETPLATMIDAFNKALDNRGGSGGGNTTVKAEIRGRTLFEVMLEEARLWQSQTGNNPFDLA